MAGSSPFCFNAPPMAAGLHVYAVAIGLALAAAACRDRAPQAAPAPLDGSSTPPPPAGRPPAQAATSPRTIVVPDDSAGSAFTAEKVTGDAQAMGTHLTYVAFTTPSVDAAHAHAAFDAATAEIQRIEALMTTWRPDGEVAKVNAAAGKSAVVVSPETLAVIDESIHASQRSQGTFDITFETLHGLWKFDEDLDPHPPTDAQIQSKLAHLGFRHIKVDDSKRTVMLDDPQTRIGLGGIAKGYAVDRAAAVLDSAGLGAYIVQAGGDLYTHGTKPDGSEWSAGIRDPRGAEGDFFCMLQVSGHAFSTAGDYERSYVVDGKRYHHIIDPRTGKPATASRSVTIWAPTAFLADEIDDAVFILGPTEGLRLVESTDGVGAVIVDAQNKVWVSKRLQGKLRPVHPPTDGI
jgi:thiamine biosynthesis lipoprotein